jgi:mRNA interferase RelE/StbE
VANYKVWIKPSAAAELEALPKKPRVRIAEEIQGLSGNPRPAGCQKLSGDDRYRLRQRVFRIVYSVSDEAQSVLVVKVGHRREVYR